MTTIAASAISPPSSAFSRASSQTSSISSAGIGDEDDGCGSTVVQRDRNDGRFRRGADKGPKPARRLGLPIGLAKIDEASEGSPTPARTCRRCCRLATRFLTTAGSGASGERASVVATKSLVSRIALCVSARARPLACQTSWIASATSQSANSEAKMRLSRLLSEIERHIRFEPFSHSPLILLRRLSMLTEKCSASRCLAARARSTNEVAIREASARCGFLSSTTTRSSSQVAARFSREPDIEVIEAQDGAAVSPLFSARSRTSASSTSIFRAFQDWSLLRRILEREPEARLVIFSMNDDPTVAARAIEAGGQGLYREE